MTAGTPCLRAHRPVQRSVARSDTSSVSGRSWLSRPVTCRLRHSTRYPPVNGTRGARSVITRPCAVCWSLSRGPGMIRHRLVPRGQVAGAEFAQRGAQAARLRRDEVGEPDDPHMATLASLAPEHRGVVPDQFLGQGRPAPAENLAPARRAERRAQGRIGGQPRDRGRERVRRPPGGTR